MPYYECYLFGRRRREPACTQIECGDEAAALTTCRDLLTERPRYVAFELWQFRRLIHREERHASALAVLRQPGRGRFSRLLH
jgi:hypothetical protein